MDQPPDQLWRHQSCLFAEGKSVAVDEMDVAVTPKWCHMAPMDTTPLIEQLRQDLARAAEVGGPETKAAAERLLMALEPAVRLMLMDALAQAAAELGGALPGVAIEVRLKGREPEFVVVRAAAPRADEPETATGAE